MAPFPHLSPSTHSFSRHNILTHKPWPCGHISRRLPILITQHQHRLAYHAMLTTRRHLHELPRCHYVHQQHEMGGEMVPWRRPFVMAVDSIWPFQSTPAESTTTRVVFYNVCCAALAVWSALEGLPSHVNGTWSRRWLLFRRHGGRPGMAIATISQITNKNNNR